MPAVSLLRNPGLYEALDLRMQDLSRPRFVSSSYLLRICLCNISNITMGQELQTIIKDAGLPWGPRWKSTGKFQTQSNANKKERKDSEKGKYDPGS